MPRLLTMTKLVVIAKATKAMHAVCVNIRVKFGLGLVFFEFHVLDT